MKSSDSPLTSPFAAEIRAAIKGISASKHTREAYWVDARHWLTYCAEKKINPTPVQMADKADKPKRLAHIAAVSGWMEEMGEKTASMTRARRIAALSSIYEHLRRQDSDLFNPFSSLTGPKRERAIRERPTPIVKPDAAAAMFAACAADETIEGRRDEAILRLLWATGVRRTSVATLTHERLSLQENGYFAEVIAKRRKTVRVLILGKAAEALRNYLALSPYTTGAVFRELDGKALKERDIWRVVKRRAVDAGVVGRITAHGFRVAFLTYSEAGLEARQHAAGHQSSASTELYDRQDFRGREAFEKMPEAEALAGGGKK